MDLPEPKRKPRGLIEAAVEVRKIKLNFGRISTAAVKDMASRSLHGDAIDNQMPDPVEKIGTRPRFPRPVTRGPVTT